MFKKLSENKSFKSILSFLILEVLAFTSFSFGAFSYLAFVLAFFSMIFLLDIISNKEWKALLPIIGSIVILGAISALGKFSSQSFRGYINIATFLGMIAFFIIGMFIKKTYKKVDIMLLIIASAIAIHLLISLIVTLSSYGLFHVIRFSNKFYFYNAIQYDVSKEALMLIGLSFKKVNINYFSLFPIILTSGFASLLFIDYKANRNKFLIILGFASFGLISLILVGNFKALSYLLLILILAIWYKLMHIDNISNKNDKYQNIVKKINKIIHIGLYVILVAILIILFICMINAKGSISDSPISHAISNNSFLNKLFNTNSIMSNINPILEKALSSSCLFGYDRASGYINNYIVYNDSRYFEFEVLKQIGIIGLLFLIIFIIASYELVRKYLNSDNENKEFKILIVSILAIYLFYQTFSYTSFICVHEDTYYSLFHQESFFIILFLLGYVFKPLGKDVEEQIDNQEYVDESSLMYKRNIKD